ncbi:MAG: sulfatase-like hydrolase/transferase [Planctomycetes bacterium]|nr:sulfatase-like hydrolase/transferase [Planctomycetota bacterium]
MNRRDFLGSTLATVAGLVRPEDRRARGDSMPSNHSAPTQPNFIIILCDNLGYGDLGCLGSKKNRTPHINRLASEGMCLTSFYSSSPVCTPSRASLLTGCYAQRVDMHISDTGGWVLRPVSSKGLNPSEMTIAEILKTQDYITACLGKWHLGDQLEFLPTRHGFDYYFGIPYSEDMVPAHTPSWPPLPLLRNEVVVEAPIDLASSTRRYVKEATRFIRENRDKPFFLYFAHHLKIEKRWDRGSNRNKSTHFSTPISGTDLRLVEIVWSAVWGLGIFVLLATNLYSNWLISASPLALWAAIVSFPRVRARKGKKRSIRSLRNNEFVTTPSSWFRWKLLLALAVWVVAVVTLWPKIRRTTVSDAEIANAMEHATSLFQNDRYREALARFWSIEIAECFPSRLAQKYHNIGLVQLKLNNTSEAETALQKAIFYDPKDLNAYLLLARVACNTKDYSKALEYLRKAEAQVQDSTNLPRGFEELRARLQMAPP